MAAASAFVVYIGNADSNDIHVLRLETDSGALSPVQVIAIPNIAKTGGSMPLAVSPDRRFLYAGLRGEPFVAACFAIDPRTGALSHRANAPLADSMAYIATDRAGKFLLGASYGGNKVSVNPIGPDGLVRPPVQIVPTPPCAHAIIPDSSGRFVLAACLGGDAVLSFRFDAETGALNPNDPPSTPIKAKSGPRHLRFHPNARILYLINELDASVCVFGYDANSGALSLKQTVSALPPGHADKIWAADLQVTPDGRFLYASERGTSTIAGFAIDSTDGTLKPVGNTPTEQVPRGFAIDPTGKFLLAVGQESHHLTCHAIDTATGQLSTLSRHKVGQNPNWVEIVRLA